MTIRQTCEAWLRSFRSFVLPSHWATAIRMRAKAIPLPKDKPLCILDFRSIQIDSVSGRYLYHLVTQESGQLDTLSKISNEERCMRVFFAGNTKTPKYDAPVLAEAYKVLSRVKMIRCAVNALPKEQVHQPVDFEHLLPAKSPSLTIAHSQTCIIPSQHWLETLRKSDFFLACPGVGMPLCHNLIEALAVGSIPILQHPQYLDPSLVDGVNCLTFNSETSLVQALDKAMQMETKRIETLRRGAHGYYESHLRTGSFATNLIQREAHEITVFLNSYRIPRAVNQTQP